MIWRAIEWDVVAVTVGFGFVLGLGAGLAIAPGTDWWQQETRIAVNDQLLDAMSAHLGVPPEQITDLHLAFLLSGVLGKDPNDPLRKLHRDAIDATIDKRQPEPRRPGSTPR